MHQGGIGMQEGHRSMRIRCSRCGGLARRGWRAQPIHSSSLNARCFIVHFSIHLLSWFEIIFITYLFRHSHISFIPFELVHRFLAKLGCRLALRVYVMVLSPPAHDARGSNMSCFHRNHLQCREMIKSLSYCRSFEI